MPATDPVQAVAEAMCPTHREDVPTPLPDHHDPRLRYAACYDCALKAEAAVAVARPLIEREAKAVAVESLREFARAQDTWCDAGRAEQVITRRAMRDALLREAHRIEREADDARTD